MLSLQEKYAPSSVCFGCGPANADGLRIESFVEGDSVVARWSPLPQHCAFPGVLNGGIISTVLDCHANWTGAYSLMVKAGAKSPPATVTASIFVQFLRPTPMAPLLLEARATEVTDRRAAVEATLLAETVTTATLKGTFVAVKPDHPAAMRWGP